MTFPKYLQCDLIKSYFSFQSSNSHVNMSETSMMWFDVILQTCLDLSKTKRWRNTQKFEWMTDKVAEDNKTIPWIPSEA